jgi:hypothetical protein
LEHILPLVARRDKQSILKRATITSKGKLTKNYEYLTDFVNG